MRGRKNDPVFKQAADQLRGLEKARRRLYRERRKVGPVSRIERHHRARVSRIRAETSGEWRCPVCGEKKLKSREWVVKRLVIESKRVGCLCLSCYRRHLMKVKMTVAEVYYVIDGKALKAERRKRKVTAKAIAEACGWSTSYQHHVENGECRLQEATSKVLRAALAKHGIEVSIERYG